MKHLLIVLFAFSLGQAAVAQSQRFTMSHNQFSILSSSREYEKLVGVSSDVDVSVDGQMVSRVDGKWVSAHNRFYVLGNPYPDNLSWQGGQYYWDGKLVELEYNPPNSPRGR